MKDRRACTGWLKKRDIHLPEIFLMNAPYVSSPGGSFGTFFPPFSAPVNVILDNNNPL
jgi:hypothetical protein